MSRLHKKKCQIIGRLKAYTQAHELTQWPLFINDIFYRLVKSKLGAQYDPKIGMFRSNCLKVYEHTRTYFQFLYGRSVTVSGKKQELLKWKQGWLTSKANHHYIFPSFPSGFWMCVPLPRAAANGHMGLNIFRFNLFLKVSSWLIRHCTGMASCVKVSIEISPSGYRYKDLGHFWLGYIRMLGHLQLSAHWPKIQGKVAVVPSFQLFHCLKVRFWAYPWHDRNVVWI